jgi:hypothetical protein
MDAWAPLGLISVTATLLALPVAPAFYELRKRGDVAPLPTSRHDGRIANFADSFYSRVEPLRPLLEQCRATAAVNRINLEGMEVLLVGRDDFDFDPQDLRGVAAVMCGSHAMVPSGSVIDADVYSESDLQIGQSAAIRAALASGNIILGKDSAALRWLHAYGSVHLREGSTSYGRLSALEFISLEPGCGFQHMHAPTIMTVDSGQPASDSGINTKEIKPAGFFAGYECDPFTSRPRVRIHGDFVLPAGESMTANLIATGDLRFGPGSRFVGSAKSYKDTIVEEDASVHGSIVCGGSVYVSRGSFVAGPIIAERDVILDRGVAIGALDALTTISCCSAHIATGCRLHGTVWAKVRGNVED